MSRRNPLLVSALGLSTGITVGAEAVTMTPEQQCQADKSRATIIWYGCRQVVSRTGLQRDLPEAIVAIWRDLCDQRQEQDFAQADQRAWEQGDTACAGDHQVVQDKALTSGLSFLGSSPARNNVGFNIFGASGFEDQTAMIGTLFEHGIRKFRINNVGGWPNEAYDAINAEAGKLSASERAEVSVYVPSQYFAGQFDVQTTKDHLASWSDIPHWIIQLDACNPIDGQCTNPTETGLAKTDMADYLSKLPTWIQAFLGQPYGVEFVIPYQDGTASPDDRLTQVKQATVDAFPNVRFTLERTEYPFWQGSTNTNFPFDAAHSFHEVATSKGFDGAYFAESGWPRSCPAQPSTATRPNQCAYLKSLLSGTFPDSDFIAYWWLMGAEDVGDGCGADSWGLFEADATLACPGSF